MPYVESNKMNGVKVKHIFRNKQHSSDPVWHVQATLLAAILLQFLLPEDFLAGSKHTITVVSLLALLILSLTTPRKAVYQSVWRRLNVTVLAASIGLTNLYSLFKVLHALLNGGITNGRQLILAGINIYLTNIVVFGLVYWEMDGGGPGQRRVQDTSSRDFLFPQENMHGESERAWNPTFIDYLYVSSTNATAFSPTDTMPLSRRAKILMLAQSIVSLLAIALIAGRAVNILY